MKVEVEEQKENEDENDDESTGRLVMEEEEE